VRKKRHLILAGFLIILLAVSMFLGSIPPSPLYYLKISRETIQSFFIFGDEDNANWYLVRAEKRLREAEKLKSKNWNSFAQMQISIAMDYQNQAQALLGKLKDKTNTTYLKDRYNQNDEKLKALK
jgi:hypothetical protein